MSRVIQILFDRELAPTALRASLITGSILFTINHGAALAKGEMTKNRWLSGLISLPSSLQRQHSWSAYKSFSSLD